jgi:uncharacterized membrane protein
MTNEQGADGALDRVASMAGLIGAVAAVVAATVIWLVLTEPVTIVNAIATGEISPLVRQLAEVIYKTMVGLLDYLRNV